MDITGLLVIPLAAAVTACWLIGATMLSRRDPGFRVPFLLSYGLSVVLMEPWRVATWQELGMLGVMLLATALSVAAGCLVRAIPAALTI